MRFILANVPVVRCANPPVQSRQAITVLDDDDKTDDQLMQKTAAWADRIERVIDNLLVTEHKYTTEFSWGSLQKLRRTNFPDPWNLMRIIPT